MIDSIAKLLWPLIVIFILFSFRENVRALIKSGKSRKFSVKIGDMEVSMDELSKQQGDMIKDLQARVTSMQKEIESGQLGDVKAEATEELPISQPEAQPQADEQEASFDVDTDRIDDDISAILWVDDHPTNNAFMIDSLKYQDVQVTTATSTEEGLEQFKRGSFDCVITDMKRVERNNIPNGQAGFQLTSAIREIDKDVPIYIYTAKCDDKMRRRAKEVGATGITSSPSELLKFISD